MADIIATGKGWGNTEVSFEASTPRGKEAMAEAGGFACTSMNVRKSFAAEAEAFFVQRDCTVQWI